MTETEEPIIPDDDDPEVASGDIYTVQESDHSVMGSPVAAGLYEDDPTDATGHYKVLSADTTWVEGKTYYVIYPPGIPIYVRGGVSDMSETANAYSTYQTYLMYRTTSTGSYTKLVDIKDYSDIVPTPNMIDVTTLSDAQEKQIPGILRLGDGYQFTANYTTTNFQTVRSCEGHQYWYALYLGGTSAGVPDGSHGVFSWVGDVRAGFSGKGVDDAKEMTITCTPSTDTQWAASAS